MQTPANKQPYDTRIIEMRLLCSFNAVCSVLVMKYFRSQTALRKAAHVVTYIRFAHELVRHHVARPEHSGLVVRKIRSLRPDKSG